MSNFVGLLTAYLCQMGTAAFMATDISAQARFVAAVGATLMMLSATWLLGVVRERPLPNDSSAATENVPFLATIYALSKNKPYRNCAWAKAANSPFHTARDANCLAAHTPCCTSLACACVQT